MGRLYWKFFIFLLLAQLTAIAGVSVAIWIEHANVQNQIRETETTHSSVVLVESAASTLKYGGIEGLKQLMAQWSQQRLPQIYAVNEQNQELLGRLVPIDNIETARSVLSLNTNQGKTLDPHKPIINMKANDGHVYLIFASSLDQNIPKLTPLRHKDKHIFPFIPLLLGVFVSLIFAAILAWYFSKPIKQLKLAFASAASGNLDVRISGASNARRDELSDLGHAFDIMVTRLGELIQSQKRLLHQISHELRSPLARLQIAVGLARQQPDNLEKTLLRIERESVLMDNLIEELLELSRLESGVVKLEKEPIDVKELLLGIIEDANFEGEAKKIRVETSLIDGCSVAGQHELLFRAIDNVVRNALKYSPEQSSILIAMHTEDNLVKISVTDHGKGVPSHELDSIFEPFFRGTNTSQTNGHGIGLTIAKQVVEAHHGTIVVKNNLQTSGLTVEIILWLQH
jgi:signal transduction histidine kinase